jgi:hypothetical protein
MSNERFPEPSAPPLPLEGITEEITVGDVPEPPVWTAVSYVLPDNATAVN